MDSPSTSPLCPQACGPTVQHACKENIHLTGLCFLLSHPFQLSQRLPAAMQGKCWGHQILGGSLHTHSGLQRAFLSDGRGNGGSGTVMQGTVSHCPLSPATFLLCDLTRDLSLW